MSVLLFLVNGVNHLMVVDVGWEILMYCVWNDYNDLGLDERHKIITCRVKNSI